MTIDRDSPVRWLGKRSVFLVVGAIAAFYLAERRMTMSQEFSEASLERLLAGTAWTPYQFRALVPWVSSFFWKAGYLTDVRGYFFWVEASFLFGSLVAFRQLIAQVIRGPLLCDLLAFTLFWIIPFNFIFAKQNAYYYPYDMPSVFFFTVGLVLLRQENWKLYYPLFALATFNRETTCFLTVIFALTSYRKRPVREILNHVLAQAAIWLAVKGILWYAYASNSGGGVVQSMFNRNTRRLMWQPFILSTLGYVWVPVLLLRKRIADAFFQRAVLVFYPFMAAMLFVGRADEIRIHAELIPVVLIGAILIVKDAFREEFAR